MDEAVVAVVDWARRAERIALLESVLRLIVRDVELSKVVSDRITIIWEGGESSEIEILTGQDSRD